MNQNEEANSHLTWYIEKSVVCLILSLSFTIGIPGNIIVIWTVCKKMKQRSSTVLLILNLAISDLLVLATLPIWIYSFADSWVFGVPICKMLVYMVYSSMYASVFIITSLSLERFIAVFYPFSVQRRKNKAVIFKVVFLIWILSFGFGVSIIPFQDIQEINGGLQCVGRSYSSNQQKILNLLLETFVGFVIPFAIICTCYMCVGRKLRQMSYQSKQRTERLIVSVVVAFAVCWFPHHLFNIISIVSMQIEDSNQKIFLALNQITDIGVYISGALVFISSCTNPVLYAFAAWSFQSHLGFTKISRLFAEITQNVIQEVKKDNSLETVQDTLIGTGTV
ncbi:PREDICTED: leukotriene B4 receptor 1-like [Gavialis gangeticus]|uniref:leukotriene B4 receptor 1-like n=1 Tax=Gavialis gangeticus TaxID=94835 RepID=UPI00092FA788|nr:PREDICTED: leukotriene B4 receptor 1-like [Gavialis gangeticus]